MTIRSILAVFHGTAPELPMLRTAFELAVQHHAQLRCLHISLEPIAYAGAYGEAMLLSDALITSIERENAAQKQQATQYFESLTAEFGITVTAADGFPPARHASVTFEACTGFLEDIIARESRFCDLIIMRRALTGAISDAYRTSLVSAIFHTCKPLLLIPDGKPIKPLDHTVVIGWNGSKEASSALQGAMPFLTEAEQTHLLIARQAGDPLDLAADQKLLSYMKLHGIPATVTLIDRHKHQIGNALLDKARELQAGLLVLGAYGHSRFREVVLGGVTEYVLTHADIPLLMAH